MNVTNSFTDSVETDLDAALGALFSPKPNVENIRNRSIV